MPDLLQDIADSASALTDPRHNAEPRHEWDRHRNRKPLPPHITTVPGLIQQLRDLAEDGTPTGDGTGVRSIPESRPPGAFDAVSLLAAVAFGAAWRLTGPVDEGGLGMAGRPDVESNIRAIVGAAASTDSDIQRDIRHELRSWQRQAEVILGWQSPPIELVAPCPVVDVDGHGTPCGARGTLLADREGTGARCVKCGSWWDDGNIGVLLAYVNEYTGRSRRAAEDVRLRVRAAKVEERRLAEEARKARERAIEAA